MAQLRDASSQQWVAVGPYTAPAVPASTTPLANPTGTAMLVMVMGGTVTVIAVGGVTVGTVAGTFLLLPGQSIAITYSVAPTWQWYKLP